MLKRIRGAARGVTGYLTGASGDPELAGDAADRPSGPPPPTQTAAPLPSKPAPGASAAAPSSDAGAATPPAPANGGALPDAASPGALGADLDTPGVEAALREQAREERRTPLPVSEMIGGVNQAQKIAALRRVTEGEVLIKQDTSGKRFKKAFGQRFFCFEARRLCYGRLSKVKRVDVEGVLIDDFEPPRGSRMVARPRSLLVFELADGGQLRCLMPGYAAARMWALGTILCLAGVTLQDLERSRGGALSPGVSIREEGAGRDSDSTPNGGDARAAAEGARDAAAKRGEQLEAMPGAEQQREQQRHEQPKAPAPRPDLDADARTLPPPGSAPLGDRTPQAPAALGGSAVLPHVPRLDLSTALAQPQDDAGPEPAPRGDDASAASDNSAESASSGPDDGDALSQDDLSTSADGDDEGTAVEELKSLRDQCVRERREREVAEAEARALRARLDAAEGERARLLAQIRRSEERSLRLDETLLCRHAAAMRDALARGRRGGSNGIPEGIEAAFRCGTPAGLVDAADGEAEGIEGSSGGAGAAEVSDARRVSDVSAVKDEVSARLEATLTLCVEMAGRCKAELAALQDEHAEWQMSHAAAEVRLAELRVEAGACEDKLHASGLAIQEEEQKIKQAEDVRSQKTELLHKLKELELCDDADLVELLSKKAVQAGRLNDEVVTAKDQLKRMKRIALEMERELGDKQSVVQDHDKAMDVRQNVHARALAAHLEAFAAGVAEIGSA